MFIAWWHKSSGVARMQLMSEHSMAQHGHAPFVRTSVQNVKVTWWARKNVKPDNFEPRRSILGLSVKWGAPTLLAH